VTWILFMLSAYLLGSIPFGVLIARSRGIDITAHGSGNIGATNVGRVLGRGFGLTCFLLDVGKGLLPVAAYGWWHDLLGAWATASTATTTWMWLAIAVAALAGHMWSVFLGYRGGKGVATAFGGLLAIWPTLGVPALLALGIWGLVVAATRIVSAASIAAAITLPISTAVLLVTVAPAGDGSMAPPIVVSGAICVLVLWRHRSNMGRLLRGGEHRIGSQR